MYTTLYRTSGKKDKENYITEIEQLQLKKDAEGIENEVVNLYPELEFESFEAFGGAITDSAAYVYSLMNQEQKKQIIFIHFP